MLYMPQKFTAKEKKAYLMALTYILYLHNPNNALKQEYLQLQIREVGISEDKYKEINKPCSKEALIKSLKSLSSVLVQRYIIREMIMLSIADHELTDDEIRSIYQISEAIGVNAEKVGDFFIWAAKGIEWKLEGIQLVEEDL